MDEGADSNAENQNSETPAKIAAKKGGSDDAATVLIKAAKIKSTGESTANNSLMGKKTIIYIFIYIYICCS